MAGIVCTPVVIAGTCTTRAQSSVVCAWRDYLDFYGLPVTRFAHTPSTESQFEAAAGWYSATYNNPVPMWLVFGRRRITTASPSKFPPQVRGYEYPYRGAFWPLFPTASVGLCNLKQGRLTPKSDYSVVDHNEQIIFQSKGTTKERQVEFFFFLVATRLAILSNS